MCCNNYCRYDQATGECWCKGAGVVRLAIRLSCFSNLQDMPGVNFLYALGVGGIGNECGNAGWCAKDKSGQTITCGARHETCGDQAANQNRREDDRAEGKSELADNAVIHGRNLTAPQDGVQNHERPYMITP